MLEGLEIDQYLWGILTKFQNHYESEEVNIDQNARVKPVQPNNHNNAIAPPPNSNPALNGHPRIKEEFDTKGKKRNYFLAQ